VGNLISPELSIYDEKEFRALHAAFVVPLMGQEEKNLF